MSLEGPRVRRVKPRAERFQYLDGLGDRARALEALHQGRERVGRSRDTRRMVPAIAATARANAPIAARALPGWLESPQPLSSAAARLGSLSMFCASTELEQLYFFACHHYALAMPA